MEEQPSPGWTVYSSEHPVSVPLIVGPIETDVVEAGKETVTEL